MKMMEEEGRREEEGGGWEEERREEGGREEELNTDLDSGPSRVKEIFDFDSSNEG